MRGAVVGEVVAECVAMAEAIMGCAAVAEVEGPWERLETACVTMLELQLDTDSLTMPLMNDFQSTPAEIRDRLIVRRDAFERIFVDLVNDLPLDPKLDRGVYRLMLLTLLNKIGRWYRPGRLSREEIARQLAMIFHHPRHSA